MLGEYAIVCLWLRSVPACVCGRGRRGDRAYERLVLRIFEGMIYSNGLGCTFQLAKALWASLQKGYTAMSVFAFFSVLKGTRERK